MPTLIRSLAGLSLLLSAMPAFAQPAPATPDTAPPPSSPVPAPAPAPAPADPVEVVPPVNAATSTLPPAAPATSAAAPVVVAPAAVEPAAAAQAVPDRISVGKNGGFLQPGMLLQAWGIVTDDSQHDATSTFRLRRAEIHLKGEILPNVVAYRLMVDPAKLRLFNTSKVPVQGQMPAPESPGTVSVQQPNGDFSILQDFFITFMSDYADVSIGQFKVPVSLEGLASSSKVLLPERPAVTTRFGDRRDLGVKVEKKLGEHFFYSLGVFNGSGQNRFDEDAEKDVALRLEVYPIKAITIGGMGYTTIGKRDGIVRDRLEGDLRYDDGTLLAQGEFIQAWDGVKAPDGKRTEGRGAYGALAYTFAKTIQPVVRVGFVDPDVRKFGDLTGYYEGGLNYYIRGQEARLSAHVAAAVPNDPKAATVWTEILMAQVSY